MVATDRVPLDALLNTCYTEYGRKSVYRGWYCSWPSSHPISVDLAGRKTHLTWPCRQGCRGILASVGSGWLIVQTYARVIPRTLLRIYIPGVECF